MITKNIKRLPVVHDYVERQKSVLQEVLYATLELFGKYFAISLLDPLENQVHIHRSENLFVSINQQ